MEERPRIFISHHHKDKKLAEALSNMIKDISAGALDTFFSSSRDTKEGIRYGAEWFKEILSVASVSKACICLLTFVSVSALISASSKPHYFVRHQTTTEGYPLSTSPSF